MKWTYSIKNKLTAAFILLGLCLLVLISNFTDRAYSTNVKEMISTLYKDRVIAEVYLFSLSNNLYKIRELVNANNTPVIDVSTRIDPYLIAMDSTTVAYGNTKLTETEAIKFNQLDRLIQQLLNSNEQPTQDIMALTSEVLLLLKDLSAIQLEESSLIVKEAEQKYRIRKISSDLSFVIVIILLIVIQALVFSSKTFHMTNKDINANLN